MSFARKCGWRALVLALLLTLVSCSDNSTPIRYTGDSLKSAQFLIGSVGLEKADYYAFESKNLRAVRLSQKVDADYSAKLGMNADGTRIYSYVGSEIKITRLSDGSVEVITVPDISCNESNPFFTPSGTNVVLFGGCGSYIAIDKNNETKAINLPPEETGQLISYLPDQRIWIQSAQAFSAYDPSSGQLLHSAQSPVDKEQFYVKPNDACEIRDEIFWVSDERIVGIDSKSGNEKKSFDYKGVNAPQALEILGCSEGNVYWQVQSEDRLKIFSFSTEDGQVKALGDAKIGSMHNAPIDIHVAQGSLDEIEHAKMLWDLVSKG